MALPIFVVSPNNTQIILGSAIVGAFALGCGTSDSLRLPWIGGGACYYIPTGEVLRGVFDAEGTYFDVRKGERSHCAVDTSAVPTGGSSDFYAGADYAGRPRAGRFYGVYGGESLDWPLSPSAARVDKGFLYYGMHQLRLVEFEWK